MIPEHQPLSVELRTEQLTKAFGDRTVLAQIDLTIRAGEIVCIVGGSGSGKTVLLDLLIGLMPPTSGRILAADHNADPEPSGSPPLVEISSMSEDRLDQIRLHWAVVFQRNALFSGSVRGNMSLWLREHTTLRDDEILRRSREALAAAALDVDDVIDKDRDALSGGMAKRVAIARAIACDPLVLFYDEPTTGLDPIAGAAIQELIWNTHHRPLDQGFNFRDLDAEINRSLRARRAGSTRTSVIVTHDRDLLRRLRPRIVMLHESRVCFDGPYDEFVSSDSPPAQAYLAKMPVLHGRETR